MQASPSTDAHLAALREQVRAIEQSGRAAGSAVRPFGIEEVDGRLAGGGLAISALHEAAAASAAPGDDVAATLFLASAAARQARARPGGTVLWALARRDLFAPGLAQAGLKPDRLIYAECRDEAEVLAVMEEAVRHGSLAAVVGEVRRTAMASLRRLQLAAEQGGTTALLLRRWTRTAVDPLAVPSSAVTRWRIGCAPASPLPFGIDSLEGIGRARWNVALVRQRGGPPGEWILEAPDAEARLALPADPADRQDQVGGARRIAA